MRWSEFRPFDSQECRKTFARKELLIEAVENIEDNIVPSVLDMQQHQPFGVTVRHMQGGSDHQRIII